MLMPSKPIKIEEHDNYLMLITSDLRRPIALEHLYISQSNTGLLPVYLELEKPKMTYTLYADEVDNELVYHVESINGVKPKSNFDIFDKLFKLIAV